MSAGLAEAPGAALAAAPAPYLVVDQVSKSFGTFRALERASLTVGAGEFVSFLGPSGCGKTTLLRAIAGLDPATSGRIVQDGRDITGLPPSARDFGIVFQSYALFPNLNVSENIAYGLRGKAWPRSRRQQRVAELLTLVGLADQATKYPAQLSGGQQQRVALARALANEPGLLLLDEPLSALDAIVRLHLRQEIRALQRRLGVTTVMVTHDQEEAMGVSDRVVVMSRGRIEQIGTPEAIYRHPATAFVAGFVGRSSHFDAVVDATPGMLRAEGLVLPCPATRGLLFGTQVSTYIRPEDVRLGPQAQALPGHFVAQVTHVEFLGPICRVSLEAGRLRLEADVHPSLVPAVGSDVMAALPEDRLLVFPQDV
ncbi:ABC transporter ATP-binding protein [Falsiroseomonas selenitidurans]|uniref:ATP-binding cassette domain-containing protein n=1 Tax=Falsiroseomonas selenitidurans TaxID=2716335 RepID=A0ABX1E8M5_9PROT|nr:ATP-binding cassette domain-containing protein [Falsiroseomonas selenitidurans]NKC33163.1 ATP-binding cassette domain-containing protein [Falsiroseomonas selenitidurans]